MFDLKHYVPILRWKEAERLALRDLHEEVRNRITPLVQLVPESIAVGKRRPTVSQMLQKVAADMRQCWGTRRIFVDLRYIDQDLRISSRTHPMSYLGDECRRNSVSIVPVTGLDRPSAYQAAVAEAAARDTNGLCLRLLEGDLLTRNLRQLVSRLLGSLGLGPNHVDLVVDLESYSASSPAADEISGVIPHLSSWRSFTVASGAFPRDLTQFKTVGRHSLARLDWLAWNRQVGRRNGLVRKPAYGDYGIYHPAYSPPQFSNPSASIRYTSSGEWVIMRGEGILNEGGPGTSQWPANAQLLCGMREFCGAAFSAGDAYIHQKANNPKPTGSARTWLQAGFNHHITFVVRQIANRLGT